MHQHTHFTVKAQQLTLPSVKMVYGIGISGKKIDLPEKVSDELLFKVKSKKNCEVYTGEYPIELLERVSSVSGIVNDLDAFHYIRLKDLLIIEVKSGKIAEVEIESNLSTNQIQHILIIARQNSQVKLVEIQKGNAQFHSHKVEIIALENSKVTYEQVQILGNATVQNSTKHAQVGKDAKVTINEVTCGASHIRSRAKVILHEGSYGEINTLCNANQEEFFDFKAVSIHKGKHSTSNLLAKLAVNGKSKAIYRGNIAIYKDAFESNGFQKQDTLILSDSASCSAVPTLEIDNSQVKCSHESSVTTLNEKKLFYLQSRGLSQATAKEIALASFFTPLLEKFSSRSKSLFEGKLK